MTKKLVRDKVYIIAEAGVNHNGKLNLAKQLIEKAKFAGADAVKFQLYNTNEIASHNSQLASYQKKNTSKIRNQFELLKKYEISVQFVKYLKTYCKKLNIDFMLSVYDNESLKILKKIQYKNFIKIPSGEINNHFLLRSIEFSNNKFIISTGMSDNVEIINSINSISKSEVYSFDKKKNKIKILSNKLLSKIQKKIYLLHCVTDYPADIKYLNLNAIKTIRNNTKLDVGFSDHSIGISAAVGSVYCGAKIIEKHLTLNKKLKGPDHRASLNPKDFKLMVSKIREAEKILGSSKKNIQKCEIKNKKAVRKIVVAKNDINKGEKFSWNNLTAKRSGLRGLEVGNVALLIGKKAKKNYKKDRNIIQ